MKKTFLAVLLFAVPTLIQAQATGDRRQERQQAHKNESPDTRATREASKAAEKLKLTADQQSTWESAARERMTANEPLKEKLKGTTTPEERKQLRGEIKKNNERFDETVSATLSQEQRSEFTRMKKDRHEKRRERHGKPERDAGD
jgi:hypothetical protein